MSEKLTKSEKKTIRRAWRRLIINADHFACVMCHRLGYCRETGETLTDMLSGGFISSTALSIASAKGLKPLDAHHIVDRNEMEDGGYTLDNGATLCGDCHLKAEKGEYTEEQIRLKVEERRRKR